jgi:hypothetical protein
LLVGHRIFTSLVWPFPRVRWVLESMPGTVVRVALTFGVFCATLSVFRSPDLASGWVMVNKMVTPVDGRPVPLELVGFWVTLVLVALGHAAGWYLARSPFAWKRAWLATPAPVLGALGAAVLVAAAVLAPGGTKAFVYFQF